MRCKRNGAVTVEQCWNSSLTACMTSPCTLLSTVTVIMYTASTQLLSKEFEDFGRSRRAVMGKRLFCCSLSWTTMPSVWVSVLVVGKEAYAWDTKDEQLTFLWRLVDISDIAATTTSPRPGDDSFTNNNLSRLHLFRLFVNEPRSYNHVQGDDMCDSNPTFSCCLARVAIPCQVQQPETPPPSGSKQSFFPLLFLPLLIEEQRWNLEQGSPRFKVWCQKIRNPFSPKITLLIDPHLP